MLDKEGDVSDRESEDLVMGRIATRLAMRWYGWGSPVGLGLFIVLLAGAAALIRFAFR